MPVEEWEMFASAAKFTGFEMSTCKRLENTQPDKVSVADKPFWLRCALHAGGLGDRTQ
jgi:hypothetical protein